MVSSYPYPPQFLDWMRQVFKNPKPFIVSCASAARSNNLAGFNIDWEPQGKGDIPTSQDAKDYAEFLTIFSDAMHGEGIMVSVDVAGWSPIWNLTSIGQTSVDAVAFMGTYVADPGEWDKQFALATDTIPA